MGSNLVFELCVEDMENASCLPGHGLLCSEPELNHPVQLINPYLAFFAPRQAGSGGLQSGENGIEKREI